MPPAFTLNGTTYANLTPHPEFDGPAQSWEYGKEPKVVATLALVGGGTLDVYARAQRWTPTHVLASWEDDDRRPHWAWIPTNHVRHVTDSEWDIFEYWRCPENLRGVRWSGRLAGFLPA